ncbi:hypothetical protein BKH17_12145 [Actinomyces oris]|nr:hypothetical protein BKH17_12145 [Actinomyces oris]
MQQKLMPVAKEFCLYFLDCSYACACVVAGGINWRPADEVDVEARRAFWMWYLTEAIPSVLNN